MTGHYVCMYVCMYVTDKNSVYSNERSDSLSVWSVVGILQVFRLLLDNEWVWGQVSQAHY